MSINTIDIFQAFKLNVLIRLLGSNEQFKIACSKAGLSVRKAKLLISSQTINNI